MFTRRCFCRLHWRNVHKSNGLTKKKKALTIKSNANETIRDGRHLARKLSFAVWVMRGERKAQNDNNNNKKFTWRNVSIAQAMKQAMDIQHNTFHALQQTKSVRFACVRLYCIAIRISCSRRTCQTFFRRLHLSRSSQSRERTSERVSARFLFIIIGRHHFAFFFLHTVLSSALAFASRFFVFSFVLIIYTLRLFNFT